MLFLTVIIFTRELITLFNVAAFKSLLYTHIVPAHTVRSILFILFVDCVFMFFSPSVVESTYLHAFPPAGQKRVTIYPHFTHPAVSCGILIPSNDWLSVHGRQKTHKRLLQELNGFTHYRIIGRVIARVYVYYIILMYHMIYELFNHYRCVEGIQSLQYFQIQ